LALLLALRILAAGEAPPGAVPSSGTEAWYADYELRFRPEDAGAPAVLWRLPAWQFQEDIGNFYHQNGRPPLSPAFFVSSMQPPSQLQILQECPGLLLSSTILAAQARQSAGDCAQAHGLFQQALAWIAQLMSSRLGARIDLTWPMEEAVLLDAVAQASSLLPGWPIEAAVARFLQGSCQAAGQLSCHDAKLDLVVAVCNEDLSWLQAFPDARLWIYAKCGLQDLRLKLAAAPCVVFQELPNLAMESLAYATHMDRNYGGFADFTLFLQGKPFEHAPHILVEDAVGAIRAGLYAVPFLHLNSRRFLAGSSFCLRDLFQRLFPESTVPEVFASYCCSQFLASRNRLMAQPRTLYARIVDILLGKIPLACAQDIHYDPRPRIAVSALFEHLWHVVLGEPPLLPPRRSNTQLPLFARLDVSEGALPDPLDS
ncbi:unnamed protein product, partial [Effrenium voratum]